MENNIFQTGTTLEKIAEYGKLIADIATTIPVVPENRDGLIKRLNDHFEVLEDLIFALNDEDLIVPEEKEWDETEDPKEEIYMGGQSDD